MRSRVDFCKCRGASTRTNASIAGRIGEVFRHLLANDDAIAIGGVPFARRGRVPHDLRAGHLGF
jgi:hypothetical protein